MTLKQLFYASLFCRVTSMLCLLVFSYCIVADIEIDVTVIVVALAFGSWLLGWFFTKAYKEGTDQVFENKFATEDNIREHELLDAEKGNEYPLHPLFKEEADE